MTDDTLDMELTYTDIKAMDAAHVAAMYAKIRQSRNDLRTERNQLREDLTGLRAELTSVNNVTRRMEQIINAQNQRLAKVAMTLIDRGVLDALSLDTVAGGAGE